MAENNSEQNTSKLIACPDCGRMISRLAPACPQCGRPANVPDQQAAGSDRPTPVVAIEEPQSLATSTALPNLDEVGPKPPIF